jgi:hypothetical protein
MKGLFFDASFTTLGKIHLPIAVQFSKYDANFIGIFVNGEVTSNVNDAVELRYKKQIQSNSNYLLEKEKSFQFKRIVALLEKYQPDFVLIGGYRIYDAFWCFICNKLNIKIYFVQHGFEIDYINYNAGVILSKLHKSIRLLLISLRISFYYSDFTFGFVFDYIRYILIGRPLRSSILRNSVFHPFKSFVYSDFYKSFYSDKFGFNVDAMRIIVPQDYLRIDPIRKSIKIKGVCYIAQTLVEDRRMSENEFRNLMIDYTRLANSISFIYIKLHPRSNPKLYENLLVCENVKIVEEMPHCDVYLTHYSSLIFTAAFLSKNLVLHELKGHATPDIYKSISPIIVNKIDDLIKVISGMDESVGPSDDAFSGEDVMNPFDQIFTIIRDDIL